MNGHNAGSNRFKGVSPYQKPKDADDWRHQKDGLSDDNRELIGYIKPNPENPKLQSWYCEKCGTPIVLDLNGTLARMKVGKSTDLYVDFNEMGAFCENEKCRSFNTIAHFGFYEDGERDKYLVDKYREISKKNKEAQNIRDHLLGIE